MLVAVARDRCMVLADNLASEFLISADKLCKTGAELKHLLILSELHFISTSQYYIVHIHW